MCDPKRYGFSVVLVINRVSILVTNRLWSRNVQILKKILFRHY